MMVPEFRQPLPRDTPLGLHAPEQVAEELTLLMEGAQVVAQNKGIEQVGERLTRMVRQRLDPAT
ncbi:hypothetical protein ACCD10_18345 [Pseudomonas sp. Pseusp122]|uniref:hypothetical protein n=1 Tax=unclassified Pseudomonas TaxID=196821 RepID=UPI0039A5C854